MSVLVILIPPRARLGARAADGATAPAAAPAEGYAYVLSADGLQVSSHGQAQPSLLPRADSVVAVLAASDVSWQRITLPRAPAAKLRAALGGLLEDQLLEDDDALHLALAPGAVAGEPVWVAAMHKGWLRAEIEKLEKAGLSIERVLPSSWPGDEAQGHFFESANAAAGNARIMLCHADADGLSLLRLDGSLARSLLPQVGETPTLWTAEPAVAAPAERWLGASVMVQTEAERALQAMRSLWNLRQFDLAPRHRGTRALRNTLRQLRSPGWRPVRIGLVTLALLQLVGLNAWAWHQRQALVEQRLAQDKLLRATFPERAHRARRATADAARNRAAACRRRPCRRQRPRSPARRRRIGLARGPRPGADAALRTRPLDAVGAGLERAAARPVPRAPAPRRLGG